MTTVLSLEQFWRSPSRQLLAYPSGDENILAHRWAELQTFDLECIYSHGPETLAGLDILGLGYCGVVMRVRHQSEIRALKVLRAPAPQGSLQKEANMLIRANTVGVGPQHVIHSDNFLLMDYVDGPMLVDWLKKFQSFEAIHNIVNQLLHQAYQLDQSGLDHGDLGCITAHALVRSQDPVLIDFSGASLERRPANVTTLVQGLFISTHIATLLRPWFGQVQKTDLIRYLRQYKQQPSFDHMKSLLSYLKLD